MQDKGKLSKGRQGIGPLEDPYLKELNEQLGDARRAENPLLVSALEELLAGHLKKIFGEELGQALAQAARNARAIDEFHENLLFQNLVSAFDSVPMKRAFLFCAYSDEDEKDEAFVNSFETVILASGCEVIREYEFLAGSQLHRRVLRTPNRQTRKQFESSFGQVGEGLDRRLRVEQNINIHIGNNFYSSAGTKETKEQKDWSERFKDFTEGLRNLTLTAAAIAFLLDGTLVKSAGSDSQHREIVILKVPREKELEILPKILDAKSPQDFHEAIAPLSPKTLPNAEQKAHGSDKPTD